MEKKRNLWIIPTDKPSRLFKVSGELKLTRNFDFYNGSEYQHIYITSDEKIKEGDWCLDKFNQRWKLKDKKLIAFDSQGIKRFSTDNILGHECKKIILTTDQDLINDGVQAIDDEFLEWFVKNPSCEEIDYWKYMSGEYSTMTKENLTKCYCGHTTTCDCGPEEPKQERSYSEEDLKDAFQSGFTNGFNINSVTFKEWFEQFKKK